MKRDGDPEWFDAQYEKLPFFCFSCGILGHGGIECEKPAMRNDQGKLPYERDIPLRAPEDRRKKMQSFVDAATESYGSGSSSSARSARTASARPEEQHAKARDEEERRSGAASGDWDKGDGEYTSPLKDMLLNLKEKRAMI